MSVELILSICLGIGLAASAGFRVFVPLFAISVASYFGILPLSEDLAWLGSTTALIVLAIASISESLAYLIPIIDNLLDSIAIPLAGIAGTLVMAVNMSQLDPALAWTLAIIAGGGTGVAIKSTNATGRIISTATTAGAANPLIAITETGAAMGLSALSIFMPILAIIGLVLGAVLLGWIRHKSKRKPS